jgi:hypothetical protein
MFQNGWTLVRGTNETDVTVKGGDSFTHSIFAEANLFIMTVAGQGQ